MTTLIEIDSERDKFYFKETAQANDCHMIHVQQEEPTTAQKIKNKAVEALGYLDNAKDVIISFLLRFLIVILILLSTAIKKHESSLLNYAKALETRLNKNNGKESI